MQIIIRNFYEDQTDSHWFSMKFIPARKISGDTHNGKKGIPITFNKIVDGNDISLSEWKVMLGGSKQLIAKSEQLQKQLNKIEKSFISAIVEELGFIILEYWELNPNDKRQYKRMVEIRDYVQSHYSE